MLLALRNLSLAGGNGDWCFKPRRITCAACNLLNPVVFQNDPNWSYIMNVFDTYFSLEAVAHLNAFTNGLFF